MVVKAISTAALPLRQWPGPNDWTYKDYQALPNDGYRYEIISGELYMSPAPNTKHQQISRNLEFSLWNQVQQHDLGEVLDAPCDLILYPDGTPVQPDIMFIAKAHLDIITEGNVQGVPDLIIEILSPSNPDYDRNLKFNLYERSGVLEYWLVDPVARTIEVFVLRDRYVSNGLFEVGDIVTSTVVVGFSVAVDTVIP